MSEQTPSSSVPRRQFLQSTTAAGVSAAAVWHLGGRSVRAAGQDDDRVVTLGVMGLSRGRALAQTFAKQPNVQVKFLCDVDKKRAADVTGLIGKIDGQKPKAVHDFRQILDDDEVDALVCAAPNHWHGPATILGCNAGKHVYVEKPCSHNPYEGELMIAAARKAGKAVQMGSQRRSAPSIVEGIQAIHDGAIGQAYYARCWYANTRGTIGRGKAAAVPAHLDFDLWQGPAPRTDYVDNLVHYHWHWRWQWGNGELGNNGVHAIDLARWALQVDYPTRVSSAGGRYAFDDDQQTPDTHCVNFVFDDESQIMWEGLSCNRHGIHQTGFGVSVHGSKGTILFNSGGYVHYDQRNKEVKKASGTRGDNEHAANFLAAIRSDNPRLCTQDIDSGHKSTLLCHLGNIAHRVDRVLHCNPSNGHILDDEKAARLWKRDYADGWEPQV